MKLVIIKIYELEELSNDAKSNALILYRERIGFWCKTKYDEFIKICKDENLMFLQNGEIFVENIIAEAKIDTNIIHENHGDC